MYVRFTNAYMTLIKRKNQLDCISTYYQSISFPRSDVCLVQDHRDIIGTLRILKAHSHYCIFRMMVVFLQGDRKFPIFALMQPTAENADCYVW